MGEKKLSSSELLLRVVFSTFCGQKPSAIELASKEKNNIVVSALKS
jgi:hypothetical protein